MLHVLGSLVVDILVQRRRGQIAKVRAVGVLNHLRNGDPDDCVIVLEHVLAANWAHLQNG